MLEFGDMFSSATAMYAYFIGSAILIGINGLFATSLFLRRDAGLALEGRRMANVTAAFVVALLFLLSGLGAGIGTILAHRSAAAVGAQPPTISIDELHRKVDMKALPVQSVADYM
jgi:hypothetical protein